MQTLNAPFSDLAGKQNLVVPSILEKEMTVLQPGEGFSTQMTKGEAMVRAVLALHEAGVLPIGEEEPTHHFARLRGDLQATETEDCWLFVYQSGHTAVEVRKPPIDDVAVLGAVVTVGEPPQQPE